jgi:hypothetical protein
VQRRILNDPFHVVQQGEVAFAGDCRLDIGLGPPGLAEQPFVDVCLDRAEREFGRQRDPRPVSAALTAARDGAT